jgi:hypothetical protein
MIIVIATWAFTTGCATHNSKSIPAAYMPSENPMQDVQTALETAKLENKLLLVVLGAQWCHDSTGLVEKFQDTNLAALLTQNYHTLFVDVGYLNDLSHITQRFNQAHYYATPTVMIINPATEHLINTADMHIWGAAASIPLTEYIAYFDRYANSPKTTYQALPIKHVEAIAAFEKRNAERLTDAYKILSPHLSSKDSSQEAKALFRSQWQEVRHYRTRLQKDIQSVRSRSINNSDETLVLPSYPPFSWQTETK